MLGGARVVLGAFCHNKPTYIFLFHQKHRLTSPTRGLKKGPHHYMAKNENHPRGSLDSLNEAFWCTNCNAKNLSSLQSPIFEKISKNRNKLQFFKNAHFLAVFLVFFKRSLRFFFFFRYYWFCLGPLNYVSFMEHCRLSPAKSYRHSFRDP